MGVPRRSWPSKKRSVQSSATARRKVTSAATTAKVPPKSDEPKVEQVIRRVHMVHRGRYGAPRIHAALHAEGHTASPGRVIFRHIFSLRGCRSVGICDPEIVLRHCMQAGWAA
jgi:hypothetical protein